MLERIFTLKSDDMKLYVARHGETNLNIDDRYQGASDISLNQRGIDQARLLAEALPKEVIHVVSSPQRRALETALAIVKIRQLPLTLAPASLLNEVPRHSPSGTGAGPITPATVEASTALPSLVR